MSISVIVFHRDNASDLEKLENVDRALKKLKNKIKKSNLMIDLKRSEYYMKPSERKRQKRITAISRNQRAVAIEKQRNLGR